MFNVASSCNGQCKTVRQAKNVTELPHETWILIIINLKNFKIFCWDLDDADKITEQRSQIWMIEQKSCKELSYNVHLVRMKTRPKTQEVFVKNL